MLEDPFTKQIKKLLDEIRMGNVKQYVFGWTKADESGHIVITSHNLKGLKTTIRNAITEPRK